MAAQAVGFVYQNLAGVDLFLDGPERSVRSAVQVVFAREKVRAGYILPAPDVAESEAGPEFTVAALGPLVRMKLTSFRLKDKVHLLDLLDVGRIDESWWDRFPPELNARLRELMDSRDRERWPSPNDRVQEERQARPAVWKRQIVAPSNACRSRPFGSFGTECVPLLRHLIRRGPACGTREASVRWPV